MNLTKPVKNSSYFTLNLYDKNNNKKITLYFALRVAYEAYVYRSNEKSKIKHV